MCLALDNGGAPPGSGTVGRLADWQTFPASLARAQLIRTTRWLPAQQREHVLSCQIMTLAVRDKKIL